MRFTIDRINDLRKHYGCEPAAFGFDFGCGVSHLLDDLDRLAGVRTHWYSVGYRVKLHEDHIEFGLPYFWLGREAEENR